MTYSGAIPTATKAGKLRAPDMIDGTPGVAGLSRMIVRQKTTNCPGLRERPRKCARKSSLTGEETARDSLSVAPPSGITRAEIFDGIPSLASASRSSTGTVASEDRLVAAVTCAGNTARAKRPSGTRPPHTVTG
jgi:hypothetical protein